VNRRVLIQVAAPAVVIGLILLGTCLASAWYINRLQRNLSSVLSHNVANLQAAQELEIRVRQLRFHSFLYLIDPSPARLEVIQTDHHNFETALELAKESAYSERQRVLVQAIEDGYRQYQNELARLLASVSRQGALKDVGSWADSHPIRHIVEPCEELLHNNQEKMAEISRDSDRLGNQALAALLVLGLGGPASGLLIGYAFARALSRSIYQLSVRVQDISQRLDQDVASVRIVADGDIKHLDRQLAHVVGRVEEVAERLQRHQREMLRAEQLSAVGQLAASVAHEVRNPLTSVKMLVEAALRPKNATPLTGEDLRVMHRELDRLEHTVQDFLDFARLPAPRRTLCDLRDIIGQAIDLVRVRAERQQVEISLSSAPEPVDVEVDRAQMHTVLVNLLLNSLDALAKGGRITVETQLCNGQEACVRVSDTGPGIPRAMEGRLFTPFASTKPTGTGLGLSISQRIVQEHGGRISAANQPEGGAQFVIHLPRTPVSRERAGNGDITRDR
jgi:two-component system, NtrC family, sensor histidine kinase HydH